jgi:hypothetical protein
VQIHNRTLNESGEREKEVMKKVTAAGIAGLFTILLACTALADDLILTYTVPEVSSMTTDAGDGITFTFVEPAAGQSFAPVTDAFTISVSDNTGNPMKVVVHIDPGSVPPECENGPYLQLFASAGIGTPAPLFFVSFLDQDLITGIQSENGSSTVHLCLIADMAACTLTNGTVTMVVTYCADS